MGGVRKAFLWPRIIRGVGRRKSATGRFLQAHRFSQSAHLQVRTQGYVLHVPLKQMNIFPLFISVFPDKIFATSWSQIFGMESKWNHSVN